MQYIRLGSSDLKVSVIGIGAWQAGFKSWGKGYTREDLINSYRYAFENGINFIDTAEIYGYGKSEEIVGEAIKGYNDIVVATKVSGFRTSEDDIIKAAERSIRRLGVREIDLYQLHWPNPIYIDICKVIRRMEKTISEGYVRYIGLSNFTFKLLRKAYECTRKYDIISNQIQYSLVYRGYEIDLIPFMKRFKIGLIAYSPLGKGVLAGKTKPTSTAQRTSTIFHKASKDTILREKLEELSIKYGVTKAAVALRWIVDKGGIPIPGVKKIRHIDSILEAIKLRLREKDLKVLDEITSKYRENIETYPLIRFIPGTLQKVVFRLLGGL